MSVFYTVLLFFLVGSVAMSCEASAQGASESNKQASKKRRAKRFVQDRFAIALFGDPPLTGPRYKEIADANFNLVAGNLHADTRAKVVRQISLCQKHGLKALAICQELPAEDLPEGDACWGYIVKDEPSATLFPELAKKVEAIRKARPGRLPLINLMGNYVQLTPENLGARDYQDHLDKYMAQIDPEVLSMDYYPFFLPSGDDRDGLCNALEPMRKSALKHGIPFWNCINCMPYGMHTDPTEGQLRWQIYTSLAYGSKGIIYFCYFTPLSPEFPKGGAIIGRDGRRTRHWYQARRINEQLMNLGPTLMKLTSTGVYRVKDGDGARFLKRTGIKSIVHAEVDPPQDYLVGAFKHADGRRAVMFNNYRFAFAAWPTIEFGVPLEHVREVDKYSGKEVSVLDDSPDMDGLQISLDSGEGRLFLLPSS